MTCYCCWYDDYTGQFCSTSQNGKHHLVSKTKNILFGVSKKTRKRETLDSVHDLKYNANEDTFVDGAKDLYDLINHEEQYNCSDNPDINCHRIGCSVHGDQVIEQYNKDILYQTESTKAMTKLETTLQFFWGVTINVMPNKIMNKKKWSTYTHVKQKGQLDRIIKSVITKCPKIKIIEHTYEVCPKLGNIHAHLYVNCTLKHIKFFTETVNRICAPKSSKNFTKTTTARDWETIRCEQTFLNPDAWLEYIRKDLPKP